MIKPKKGQKVKSLPERMKVFIYIRVSTIEQAREGVSIGTQRTRLTAFVESQDWDIHDFYVDEGESAKDLERPDLQRLLKDVEEVPGNKVVLVFKLDRLTRSVQDLYKLLKVFDESNTAFRSATEVFDTTTATGRLFITIVTAMAQWERENLSERVSVNMEQMVMDGKWPGGHVPLGYERKNDEHQIVESEARTVRKIFELYNTGELGFASMARYLNEHGYRTKIGGEWSTYTVSYILQNTLYCGEYRRNIGTDKYFTVENMVKPIIDRVTFETTQQIIRARSEMHPRQATSDFIFSGRLRCGRCGGPLSGKIQRKPSGTYYNYICINKRHGKCDMPFLNEALIEKYFMRYIERFLDADVAGEVAATQSEPNGNQNELQALQRELKQLKGRRRKWQHAFGDGTITLEDLRELTAEDRAREQEIRRELDELSEIEEITFDPETVRAMLDDFPIQWKNADRSQKKMMIQIAVKSIVVDTPFQKMPNYRPHQKMDIKEVEFN